MPLTGFEIGSLVLGGLGILGGSAADPILQAQENEKNRQWQAEQSQIARDWQEKMWNQNNEYNSPAQQMQRLLDAGLNPNLVYSSNPNMPSGQLSTSAPSSNQVAPHVDTSGLIGMANFLQQQARTNSDLETAKVQRQVMHQDVLNKVSENVRIISQTHYLDSQTKGQLIANQIQQATASYQIAQARNVSEASRWQVEISKMSAKEKRYNVETTLPLMTLATQIQNQAAMAGINVSHATAYKLAVDSQNALINGNILGMEYEWESFLKDQGFDPRMPWYASSIIRGMQSNGWFNTIVAPLFGSQPQVAPQGFTPYPVRPAKQTQYYKGKNSNTFNYLSRPPQTKYSNFNHFKR